MDNQKKIRGNCFIVQTKCSAGIFLSSDIARRKPYYKYLRFVTYSSFEEAYDEFFKSFGETISKADFKVNKLYKVRDDLGWSVTYCWEFVCLLETYNAAENFEKIIRCYDGFVYWKHGMEYEQAVAFANCKLAQLGYFNSHYVLPAIRKNIPIILRKDNLELLTD